MKMSKILINGDDKKRLSPQGDRTLSVVHMTTLKSQGYRNTNTGGGDSSVVRAPDS